MNNILSKLASDRTVLLAPKMSLSMENWCCSQAPKHLMGWLCCSWWRGQ